MSIAILYPIILVGGIAITGWLARFALRRPQLAGNRAFALYAAGAAVWCAGTALGTLPLPFELRLAAERLKYLGIVVVPSSFLWMALAFGGWRRWLTRWTLALLVTVPVLTLVAVASDPWTGLIYREVVDRPVDLLTEHGLWFDWVHIPFSYLVIAAGFLTLVVTLVTSSPLARRQTWLLLVASLLPALSNMLYLVTGLDFGGIDPTPSALVLSSVLVALGLTSTRLLFTSPIPYRTVFLNTTDVVVLLDPGDRIVDMNPAALRLVGRPLDALLGRTLRDAFPDDADAIERIIDGGIEPDVVETAKAVFEVSATDLVGSGGLTLGRAVFARDVTLQRRYQQDLETFAYRDPLTGVANRRAFQEAAEQMLRLARRERWQLGLLWVDLDDFKPINDRHGHAAGDLALRWVAERLKGVLRDSDLVARVGGDEFALLLNRADRSVAEEVRARVLKALEEPVELEPGVVVTVRASVGLAVAPGRAETIEDLMRAADTDMYTVKAHRKRWGGGLPAS